MNIFFDDTRDYGVVCLYREDVLGKDMKDPNGTPVVAGLIKVAAQNRGQVSYHVVEFTRSGQDGACLKMLNMIEFIWWGGVIGTGVYLDDVNAVFKDMIVCSALFQSIAIVRALGILYGVARSIINQLGGEPNDAAFMISQASAGDFTAALPVKDNDSASQVARFGQFLEKLKRAFIILSEDSRQVSQRSARMASLVNRLTSQSVMLLTG